MSLTSDSSNASQGLSQLTDAGEIETQDLAPQLCLTPTSQNASQSTVCRSCFFQFQDLPGLRRHRCPFYHDEALINQLNPLVLRPPLEWADTNKILFRQLAIEDIIQILRNQCWAVKGLYPFVWQGQYRLGRRGSPPVLEMLTAGSKSTVLLKKYLKVKKIVSLPKAILLVDEARGIKSLLRADDLKPPPQFVFDETQESYIIRDYLPDFTTTSALTVSAPASDTSISATGSQGMTTSLSVSDSLVQDSNSGPQVSNSGPQVSDTEPASDIFASVSDVETPLSPGLVSENPDSPETILQQSTPGSPMVMDDTLEDDGDFQPFEDEDDEIMFNFNQQNSDDEDIDFNLQPTVLTPQHNPADDTLPDIDDIFTPEFRAELPDWFQPGADGLGKRIL